MGCRFHRSGVWSYPPILYPPSLTCLNESTVQARFGKLTEVSLTWSMRNSLRTTQRRDAMSYGPMEICRARQHRLGSSERLPSGGVFECWFWERGSGDAQTTGISQRVKGDWKGHVPKCCLLRTTPTLPACPFSELLQSGSFLLIFTGRTAEFTQFSSVQTPEMYHIWAFGFGLIRWVLRFSVLTLPRHDACQHLGCLL